MRISRFLLFSVVLIWFSVPTAAGQDDVMVMEFTQEKILNTDGTVLFEQDDESVFNLSLMRPDQLRIVRNAIFARHGYPFKSDDLKLFFEGFEWYEPSEEPLVLTDTERANVQYLLKAETKAAELINEILTETPICTPPFSLEQPSSTWPDEADMNKEYVSRRGGLFQMSESRYTYSVRIHCLFSIDERVKALIYYHETLLSGSYNVLYADSSGKPVHHKNLFNILSAEGDETGITGSAHINRNFIAEITEETFYVWEDRENDVDRRVVDLKVINE